MRDPKRISKILKLIEKIWKKNPDLRLGQLIDNAVWQDNTFYVEDKDLKEQLKKFYKEE